MAGENIVKTPGAAAATAAPPSPAKASKSFCGGENYENGKRQGRPANLPSEIKMNPLRQPICYLNHSARIPQRRRRDLFVDPATQFDPSPVGAAYSAKAFSFPLLTLSSGDVAPTGASNCKNLVSIKRSLLWSSDRLPIQFSPFPIKFSLSASSAPLR